MLERPGAEPVYFQWGDNGAFRALAMFAVDGRNAPRGLVYFANGSRGLLAADAMAAPILGKVSPATGWFSSAAIEAARRWVRF